MMRAALLCLGDSNTYGYDPRSYLGSRYPEDVRWTGLLHIAGWSVVNRGLNGQTVAGALASLPTLTAGAAPGATAVMLGGNDLLQGAGAQETAAAMERLLRRLAVLRPGPLLLIAPPPLRRGEWVPCQALIDESVRLTESYRALAERLDVAFADAGTWGVELTYDGVHFSPAGHAAFARGLLAYLAAWGE